MSMLAEALGYAGENFQVFPCVARGKEPAIRGGFKAATTNPATIRRYWRVPDRNIGIATGVPSRLWVLDVDGAIGEAALRVLEAQYGALPATRTVITGNGRHLWFKNNEPIPSTVGRIAPGIDTRGESGYIVAPPSIHPSGRVYAWANAGDDLAVAPAWLASLARQKPRPKISERACQSIRPGPTNGSRRYGEIALDDEISTLAAALPGGRNHALNRAAFKLGQLVGGGELDRDDVIDRLIDAADANGLLKESGFNAVNATLRSGFNAGTQNPRRRGAP